MKTVLSGTNNYNFSKYGHLNRYANVYVYNVYKKWRCIYRFKDTQYTTWRQLLGRFTIMEWKLLTSPWLVESSPRQTSKMWRFRADWTGSWYLRNGLRSSIYCSGVFQDLFLIIFQLCYQMIQKIWVPEHLGSCMCGYRIPNVRSWPKKFGMALW